MLGLALWVTRDSVGHGGSLSNLGSSRRGRARVKPPSSDKWNPRTQLQSAGQSDLTGVSLSQYRAFARESAGPHAPPERDFVDPRILHRQDRAFALELQLNGDMGRRD